MADWPADRAMLSWPGCGFHGVVCTGDALIGFQTGIGVARRLNWPLVVMALMPPACVYRLQGGLVADAAPGVPRIRLHIALHSHALCLGR